MTTPLPPLLLEGAGTCMVESLASYIVRLAWTHAATPFQLARLLSEDLAVQASMPSSRRVYLDFRALCSYSPSTAHAVELLQRLTGRSELAQGTLLPFRGVLSEGYTGCIAEQRRWCPACYEMADEGFAEPLAWGMVLISRCPIHDVPLQSRCASCGTAQRHFRGMHIRHRCGACAEKLSQPRAETQARSAWDDWCQAQMLHILGALAEEPELVFPSEPIVRFLGVTTEWSWNERVALQAITSENLSRAKYANSKPRLKTVFRTAALMGCAPLDLLRHPEQCASRMLFSAATPIIPGVQRKPRVDPAQLERLDALLKDLLTTPEHLPLPPMKSICREVGLQASVLWTRRNSTYNAYSQERAKRRRDIKHRLTDRAMTVALDEMRDLKLVASESTGRKRSVAKIMRMTGLPKNIADDAWTQALRVVAATRFADSQE